MTGRPGLVLPGYYRYYESPVKMVESADGGVRAWRVSIDDGGWRQCDHIINDLLFARGGEISVLSPEDFIQACESYRSYYLTGQGPIFALYETVKTIVDVEEREGRNLTTGELALVRGIRRKTFVMFEEQLQRDGDPGADPTIGQ